MAASTSSQLESSRGPGDEAAGSNIRVAVRCRDLSAMEKAAEGNGGKTVLKTSGMRGSELTVTVGEERDEERRAFPLGPNVESAKDKAPTTKTYPFDHVFGSAIALLGCSFLC